MKNFVAGQWIIDGEWYGAIVEENGEKYMRLYINGFLGEEEDGENTVTIDGISGMDWAASIKFVGFEDEQEMLNTGGDFAVSEAFPCGDAELVKDGDSYKYRAVWYANGELCGDEYKTWEREA